MITPISEQIVLPALLLLAHDNAGSTNAHVFKMAYDAARLVFPTVRVDIGAALVGMKDLSTKESLDFDFWNRDDIGPGVMVFDSEGWSCGFPQEFTSQSAHGRFINLSAKIISIRMLNASTQQHQGKEMPQVVRAIRHKLEELDVDSAAIYPEGHSVTAASLHNVVNALRLDAGKRKQALAELSETCELGLSIPTPHNRF